MMKLSAMASVKETKQTWVEEDDFQVLMPHLLIQVPFYRLNAIHRSSAKLNELVHSNQFSNDLKMIRIYFSGPYSVYFDGGV